MGMSLYQLDCPSCGIACWFNNGDESDLSAPDVEALRCWHCHTVFSLDSLAECSDEEAEDLYVDDSYKSANEAAGG